MQVDMRQLVLVMASAVDLVGIDDVLHGRRVGIMAIECAKRLGWAAAQESMLFEAALLHDCGVSSTRVHGTLVRQPDWDGAEVHCRKGHDLLSHFAPLTHLAPIILHHHCPWQDLARRSLAPALRPLANLICLVDQADALASPYHHDQTILLHAGDIRGVVAQGRDTHFSPALVDAFLAASASESFWLQLNADYLPRHVAEVADSKQMRQVGMGELKAFALALAQIVDAKSHFTAEHSIGVGRLARFLGRLLGFAEVRLDSLEVAALLHDIGKLQMPDEVLEKPGPFTEVERAIMKRHSFATYEILRRIDGFAEIALWAGAHHESLNGNGYPFHLAGRNIPLEARIIRVADVFQALAQVRPYRGPIPPNGILAVLRRMQLDDEVDGAVVDLCADHLEPCYAMAVGGATAALT